MLYEAIKLDLAIDGIVLTAQMYTADVELMQNELAQADMLSFN